MCDAWSMAQTVCVIVSAADRERLQAIIGDRANYGTGGGADLHHSDAPGDPLDRPGYGQGGRASRCARCSASGRRASCSPTASARSSVRAIRALSPSWPMLSDFTSIHRPTPLCSHSTKRVRSKRSTAPNRGWSPDLIRGSSRDLVRLRRTITSGTARPPCSLCSACSTAPSSAAVPTQKRQAQEY